MKIRIDEKTYEETGEEILDQLRFQSFDPTEFPDAESYLWQFRNNFMRATDLDCVLLDSGLERQARTMFAQLPRPEHWRC